MHPTRTPFTLRFAATVRLHDSFDSCPTLSAALDLESGKTRQSVGCRTGMFAPFKAFSAQVQFKRMRDRKMRQKTVFYHQNRLKMCSCSHFIELTDLATVPFYATAAARAHTHTLLFFSPRAHARTHTRGGVSFPSPLHLHINGCRTIN